MLGKGLQVEFGFGVKAAAAFATAGRLLKISNVLNQLWE
jgi:hypothetical protein